MTKRRLKARHQRRIEHLHQRAEQRFGIGIRVKEVERAIANNQAELVGLVAGGAKLWKVEYNGAILYPVRSAGKIRTLLTEEMAMRSLQ